MSHADTIEKSQMDSLYYKTDSIPVVAFMSNQYGAPVYAIQFHPEVTHSLFGLQILKNFLYTIVGMKGD